MRVLLFFLGVMPLLRAEEPPFVKVELVTLALYQPLQKYSVQHGEARSLLDAGVTGIGQSIAYEGPARLSLFAPTPEAWIPGSAPLPPVAQVDLPPNASWVLLICIKRKDQPLRLMACDVSGEQVHAGDYVFFHFAKSEVAVKLGEETFSLKPGEIRVVDRKEWRNQSADLLIRLVTKVGNKNRLVFSSVWGHHSGHRNYVFLFNGEHASMPVVMRKIQEVGPTLTEKESGH